MLGEIRGEVRFKEPLSFHTSLRIGGPADIFVVPQDVEDIRCALSFAEREQLPIEVIGGGNNLLVSDRGVRGVVLKLEGCLGRAEFHGEEAVAGAGVSLSALIREAAALNLGGIECLVGIPATIGGAVAMNAGTPDGCIGDFVSAVYFLHPDGTLGEFKPGAGSFSYRMFAAPPRAVLIGARLQLHRRPFAEIQKDIKQRLKQKKATQPLALASAGCVWKNPPGETAARLIEKVGLKGKRLNGAEISAKHANFIVNRGRRRRRRHQGAHGADARAGAQPVRHHARARDQDHGGDLRAHSSVLSPRARPRPARGPGRARPPRSAAAARRPRRGLARRVDPPGALGHVRGRSPIRDRAGGARRGRLGGAVGAHLAALRRHRGGGDGGEPAAPRGRRGRLRHRARHQHLPPRPRPRWWRGWRRCPWSGAPTWCASFPNRVTIAVEERRPFTLVHAGRLHWIDEQGVTSGPRRGPWRPGAR